MIMFEPPAAGRWEAAAAKLDADDVSIMLARRNEGIIDGSIRSLPMPWPTLAKATRALLPGMVMVVCGDPGSAKSLLTMQLFHFHHLAGTRVSLFELECDKVFHANRLLAQLCGEPNVTDPDWVRDNPHEARYFTEQHEDALRDFGARMSVCPETPIDHDGLLRWLTDETARGSQLLGIDPITATTPSQRPWEADQNFIVAARKIIGAAGASLVVVTHPRKGAKGSSGWEDLAGGAAWSRFTDTVIWLERPEEPERVLCQTAAFGRQSCTINRRIRVCKARNGAGYGLKIGMVLETNLAFTETGLIVGEVED